MNTRKKITSLFVAATACFVLHNVVAAEMPAKKTQAEVVSSQSAEKTASATH